MDFSEKYPGLFRICGTVHDEIVLAVRGRAVLDESKYKFEEGIFKPAYKIEGNAKEVADYCQNLMEDAESELFDRTHAGRAEYDLAPFWNH